jgi:hypothetical protein
MMAAALCSFWFLLKGNHGNFSEIIEHFLVFCMLLIICVTILRQFSPNS